MSARRGLSLIEVVLTLVILGLAVPALLVQMTANLRQQEALLVQENLTRLAAQRLWEIFADQANPARGYAWLGESAYPAENKPDGLEGYSRATAVREVDPKNFVSPLAGSGLKRFKITVTGPGPRSLTLESFVANFAVAAELEKEKKDKQDADDKGGKKDESDKKDDKDAKKDEADKKDEDKKQDEGGKKEEKKEDKKEDPKKKDGY